MIKKNCCSLYGLLLGMMFFLNSFSFAKVPEAINYQGRINVGQIPFSGTGYFKFAIVNADSTQVYWTNDGSVPTPLTEVNVEVVNGIFNINLGNTNISNMKSISASVFISSIVYLRVWFRDGTNPSEELQPKQPLVCVGYAFKSALSDLTYGIIGTTVTSQNIVDGTITDADIGVSAAISTSKLSGAVTAISNHGLGLLETQNSVGDTQIDAGAIDGGTGGEIQDGTITNDDISNTANISPSKISGTAWTSTNDGSGSGLDADKLDNKDSSEFIQLQNTTPGTQQTGNMNISGTGIFGDKVGIGTTPQYRRLVVNGDSNIRGGLILGGITDNGGGIGNNIYMLEGTGIAWYNSAFDSGRGSLTANNSGDIIINPFSGTTSRYVGIGTTNPQSNLQIRNGTSKEIQVGGTAGVFSNSTYFTDLNSGGSYINLSAPSDGKFKHSIFSYSAAGKDNLGVTARSDIKFVVGDTADRGMVIQDTGRVGIGTTNPQSNLEIYDTDAGIRIRSDNASTNSNTQIKFGGTVSGGWSPIGSIGDVTTVGNALSLSAESDVPITFWTTSSGIWNEKLRITPGGNVGIGTTDPVTRLTINSPSGTGWAMRIRNGDAIRYRSDYLIGSNGLNINAYDDTGSVFLPIQIDASKTILGIQGNIGIGTTNPASKLEVKGASAGVETLRISNLIDGRYLSLGSYFVISPNEDLVMYSGTGKNLILGTNSNTTGDLYIKSDGNVGIGVTNPEAKLHVSGGKILLDNAQYFASKGTDKNIYNILSKESDDNTYIDSAQYNKDLRFRYNNGQTQLNAMTISGAASTLGNVGMGTTNPQAKLQIQKTLNQGQNEDFLILHAHNNGFNSGSSIKFENFPIVGIPSFIDAPMPLSRIKAFDTGNYSGAISFETQSEGFLSVDRLTEKMRITSDGKVGIGITNPQAKLDVNGDTNISGKLTTLTASGESALILKNITGGSNVTTIMKLGEAFDGEPTGTGATIFTNTLVDSALHRANRLQIQTWNNLNSLNTGIVLDESGNLGIGTTDPSGLQINTSVSETPLRGIDNVRLGIGGTPDATPRIILEDSGTQWEIDNFNGNFRIFKPTTPVLTIDQSGTLMLKGETNMDRVLTIKGILEEKTIIERTTNIGEYVQEKELLNLGVENTDKILIKRRHRALDKTDLVIVVGDNGVAGEYNFADSFIIASTYWGTPENDELNAMRLWMHTGDVEFAGTKSAVIPDPRNSGENIYFYTTESPKVAFEDFGESQLQNGEIEVKFTEEFSICISTNSLPQIILTPLEDCNGLYISQRSQKGFVVKELNNGVSNTRFCWRAVSIRKGYETVKK